MTARRLPIVALLLCGASLSACGGGDSSVGASDSSLGNASSVGPDDSSVKGDADSGSPSIDDAGTPVDAMTESSTDTDTGLEASVLDAQSADVIVNSAEASTADASGGDATTDASMSGDAAADAGSDGACTAVTSCSSFSNSTSQADPLRHPICGSYANQCGGMVNCQIDCTTRMEPSTSLPMWNAVCSGGGGLDSGVAYSGTYCPSEGVSGSACATCVESNCLTTVDPFNTACSASDELYCCGTGAPSCFSSLNNCDLESQALGACVTQNCASTCFAAGPPYDNCECTPVSCGTAVCNAVHPGNPICGSGDNNGCGQILKCGG